MSISDKGCELPEQIPFEEAQDILRDCIPAQSFFNAFEGSEWTKKVEALQLLTDQYSVCLEHQPEATLAFLQHVSKDWKEANLSIIKEIFNIINTLITLEDRPVTKRFFPYLAEFILEKMTDTKFSDNLYIILESCCQSVTPAFALAVLL